MDALAVLSRWTHIASMTFIVGGALYARLILAPAMAGQKVDLGNRIAAALRPWMLMAVSALVASGLYNLLTKKNLPPGYHMVFGIKMLLALHVIAVAILLGRPGVDAAKRNRWTTGIVISGMIVLALSAYLRAMQL